jgi:TRAP-type uncharacterized transport system substrate-binding protein
VVQKDGPVRSVRDLKGRKVGITQLGSTFHYMLGNLLEQEGLTLATWSPRRSARSARWPRRSRRAGSTRS